MKNILFSILLLTTVTFSVAQTKKAPVKSTVKAKTAMPVVVTPPPAPEPVLMTIGSDTVTRAEFDRVYKKNNRDSTYTESAIREYLDLYINYKAKVKEAEALMMDTSEAFKNELSGYRKQLAAPYLTDKDVNELLVKEAYERLKKDVRASHILIKLDQNALPKDTVVAWNRIMKIRDMILKGSDFNKVAKDSSDDPSAKDNGGDLGYFTGMQMVYPFETAAYNAKDGQVTMPVRTRFGYHIIKVTDSRPAQGEVHVQHVMVRLPKEPNDSATAAAKAKINEAYKALKSGMPWDSVVVKFSEDKSSVKRGGELPWFGTGRMVPEFEKAAFALKNKDNYSEVVATSYGYHIIRLIEKRGVPPFDDKKAELKAQISRDSRNEASRNSMIAKIKAEYSYKEFPKAKDELLALLDSSLSNGEWDLNKAENMEKSLISFTAPNGKTTNYTQQDFAKYISTHQTSRKGVNPMAIGLQMFNDWTGETALAYEESRLDEKYPEFKNLMKEYRDGILLFDLTDKMVWTKAVKDTAGLEAYYDKNKTKYMWGDRCDADIYSFTDQKVAVAFRKQFMKGKKTVEEIINDLNKNNSNAVSQKAGRYNRNDEIITMADWKEGLSKDIVRNGIIYIANIRKIIPAQPKTIEEAKGVITSDYQNYLEKTWIDSLRAKYPVKVNQEVLQSLWKH